MTALATETTTTFCAGADTHEASEVFHVEHRGGHTGQRVELARYTISGGERILYGQRINGVVRVTDRPAGQPGRSYLIERGLERDGYEALKALVADYTSQAEQLDGIPMAVSLVRHTIEQETA